MRTGMLEKLCRESGSPCHSFSVLVKAINHWTLDNSHAEDRSRLADKAVIFMSRLPPAQVIGMLLLLAGRISAYLPALVGAARVHRWSFLAHAPAFFLTAAMFGSVLPLLCQISVLAGEKAGSGVSLVYVSNIIGSVLGSLGIGFVCCNTSGFARSLCS